MASVKQASPPNQGPVEKLPKDLPHGVITPPAPVLERIEQERAKHPPEVFAKHELRLLNDWTIGYTFDSLCLEVVYRRTQNGPEVLAVGTEEATALRKATPLSEQMSLETFLGYS
jgi:hypothetical protein